MKFAVVGLGSMGKRRVRDLLALGHQVVGFDIRSDRCAQAKALYSIEIVETVNTLFQYPLDACIISTPPDVHYEYYQRCYDIKLPFFSEANIFTPKTEWFERNQQGMQINSCPSATWRFHPLFKKLKMEMDNLGSNNVNTVIYHYGGYLPSWHPWESYTEFYAGRKKTSAAREMVVFELEALMWIFGKVKNVSAKYYRAGDWSTDMDDTYNLLIDFESGVRGILLIELHQVVPFRKLNVSCKQDSYSFDVGDSLIEHYNLSTNLWRKMKPEGVRSLTSFNFEDVYFAEIKGFVEGLHLKNYPKTWEEDRHLSDVLFAAERSAAEQRTVYIEEIMNTYDGISWINV